MSLQLVKYKPSFYKKLSLEEKKTIYMGAMMLANGFLSFDSFQAAGSGGGALPLTGRILALHATQPYLLRMATDLAVRCRLVDITRLGMPIENDEADEVDGEGLTPEEAAMNRWLADKQEMPDIVDEKERNNQNTTTEAQSSEA